MWQVLLDLKTIDRYDKAKINLHKIEHVEVLPITLKS